MTATNLSIFYGAKKAVGPLSMIIPEKHVTSLIGPSGCGKSTFLRSLNRMNELIPGCRMEGEVKLDGDAISRAPYSLQREANERVSPPIERARCDWGIRSRGVQAALRPPARARAQRDSPRQCIPPSP
jgi:ABC-type cobalamin/Fe3+-siderophores transport system ATPase subunit